jgi:uncharacterized protein (PEP-CTERM system associated)
MGPGQYLRGERLREGPLWRRRLAGAISGSAAAFALAVGPTRSQTAPAPVGPVPAPVAPAQPAEQPPFFVTASVGVQQSYTDNVKLTPEGGQGDFFTRGFVDLGASVNDGRLTANLTGEYTYDWYARERGLSGSLGSALGSGAYTVLKDHLWLEVSGVLTESSVSAFSTSAVTRSGVPGLTQVAIYQLGPRVDETLGGVVDLAAAVRFQQILYSGEATTASLQPPPDDTVGQAVFSLDTAKRSNRLQLLTTGQFERDAHSFQSANAIQSAYLRVAPNWRLIARAGYEQIGQSEISTISAPILSAGFEFTPNQASLVRVEGGWRYDRASWSAEANLHLSDRTVISALYSDIVAPDQLYLASSFAEFVALSASLPPPTASQPVRPPPSFAVNENLYDQVSFSRAAELRVAFQWPTQLLQLSTRWSDREFLATGAHDRSVRADAAFTRNMRPDLSLTIDASYQQTFASPLYGASRTYSGAVQAAYQLNPKASLNVSYNYTLGQQLFTGGANLQENVFLISLQKRF